MADRIPTREGKYMSKPRTEPDLVSRFLSMYQETA
jgi:hypothetical protein